MKKAYIKPELGVRAYAQFENVYTGCNKNDGWISSGKRDCAFNPAWTSNTKPKPENYCAWLNSKS